MTAFSFSLDVRSALANLDKIQSGVSKVAALQSGVTESVQPIISAAKSIVQQPGNPDYWPRYGRKKRKKHLRDTIGSTTRIYANTIVGVVGPLAPAGVHGWNVERGHRMATGGTLVRTTEHKIKWRPGGPGRQPKFNFRRGSTPIATRGITGGGTIVGQTKPFPFVSVAAESQKSQTLAILTATITKHIDAAVAAGGGS